MYDLIHAAFNYDESGGDTKPRGTVRLAVLNAIIPRLKTPMQFDSIDELERLCRFAFAIDKADEIIEKAELLIGDQKHATVCSALKLGAPIGPMVLVEIPEEATLAEAVSAAMNTDIDNGSVYRILADLYPTYPKFCDGCFPLERKQP